MELVLEQSLVLLEIQGSGRDFILRVHGLNEFLCPGVPVSDFRYIQECIKLDQDVKLVLVQRSSLERKTWSRTVKMRLTFSNLQNFIKTLSNSEPSFYF